MRRQFVAAVILMVLAGTGGSALPQPQAASSQFAAIYRQYAAAIQSKGARGLEGLVTPDFRFRQDGRWLHGKEAFAAMGGLLSFVPGGRASVRLRRVRTKGDVAIVVIEETVSVPRGKTIRTAGLGGTMEVTGPVSASATWKHTWRRTSRGWRLATMEAEPGGKSADTGSIRVCPAG